MKDTRWWGALILAIMVAGWLVNPEYSLERWLTGGLFYIWWPMKEK